MKIEEFLEKCEAACDVPVVYSKPLAQLAMLMGDLPDEWDEDESLTELISAAYEVAGNWAFYPPEQYGSNLATIDAQSVMNLADALAKYRQRPEADDA